MTKANNMAKSLHDQLAKGDSHALRLTAMPYAGNLFAIYTDNCAPVSGYTRQAVTVVGGRGGVDGEEMMPFLAALAPKVG